MRILRFTANYRPLGGGEYYFLTTTRLLERDGHRVAVVKPRGAANVSITGRPEYDITPSQGFRTGRRASREIDEIARREHPDVALIHTVHGFVSSGAIARLGQAIPVVHHVHDARFFCPVVLSKRLPDGSACVARPFGTGCLASGCFAGERSRNREFSTWLNQAKEWFYRYLFLRAARRADAVLVGSEYMQSELAANGVPPRKIRNVRHLLMDSPSEGRGNGGRTEDEVPPLLLAVGRFDLVKGLEEAVRMLCTLPPELPWRAKLVGDGPMRDGIIDEVGRSDLAGRFEFAASLGREEMMEEYGKATICIMPSMIPEAFGVVGIEALACGTPVIAFDSGGVREWMRDGEYGFMVPTGDFGAMREKIILLLEDRGLRRRLGGRGRAAVTVEYAQEEHIRTLVEALEAAIRDRKRGR